MTSHLTIAKCRRQFDQRPVRDRDRSIERGHGHGHDDRGQRQTSQSGTVLLIPVVVGGIVTGLGPGTQYWLNMSFAAGAGTASLQVTSCTLMEF